MRKPGRHNDSDQLCDWYLKFLGIIEWRKKVLANAEDDRMGVLRDG